jgi:hypothetical protein
MPSPQYETSKSKSSQNNGITGSFDVSKILENIMKSRCGESLPEKTDPEVFKAMADRGFSMIRLAGKVPPDGIWQKACSKRAEYDPKKFNGFNAGIACGKASGTIVFDADNLELVSAYLEANGLELPPTFTVVSGRDGGGLHKYYQYPDDGRNYGKTAQKKYGFDVLGSGAQVVCPGSVHPDTGRQYKILDDLPIAPAPKWILNLVSHDKKTEHQPGSTGPDVVLDSLNLHEAIKDLILNPPPKPGRSEAEMSVINSMVAHGYGYEQILSILEQYPIGEKHRGSGSGRFRRLQGAIAKAKIFTDGGRQETSKEAPEKFPVPITAAALRGMNFKAPEWIIAGILLVGLYIFAAKPKMGKSMMALNLALSVASGGVALGAIPVRDTGEVIYFSLEDNYRRLKQRLDKMCPGVWPENLLIYDTWAGVPFVESIITDKTRLVIIDTLQRTRTDRNAGKQDLYQYDYKSIAPLQTIASQKNIAILIIHHLRKSDDDDPHSCISGSLGLTGAADGTWVLKRKTGQADAVLYTQGRDFEGQELALKFHAENFMWELLGDAIDIQSTGDRQAVYDAIKQAIEPIKSNAISQMTGIKPGTVSRILFDYLKEGKIEKAKYGYYKIIT